MTLELCQDYHQALVYVEEMQRDLSAKYKEISVGNHHLEPADVSKDYRNPSLKQKTMLMSTETAILSIISQKSFMIPTTELLR